MIRIILLSIMLGACASDVVVREYHVPFTQLGGICGSYKAMGCAIRVKGVCHIFLPERATPHLMERIRKHEIRHCHEGAFHKKVQ